MTKPKHTPGSWHRTDTVLDEYYGYFAEIRSDVGNTLIAITPDGDYENHMKLLLAAPEMLAALEAVLDDTGCRLTLKTHDIVSAAIAKAKALPTGEGT